MSDKKQTAVQWLHQTWGNYPNLWTWEKIQEWFEKAKIMEREQMEEAVSNGISKADMTNNRGYFDFDKWYIETYGGNK